MENKLDLILQLKELASEKHYYCEDSWYSCPKAEGGCFNDQYEKDECSCGADKRNAIIEKIIQEIING